MANSKRNEQDTPREDLRSDSPLPQQENEKQDVSSEDENPQRGDSWNNYRTREMSGGNDENFYRNRERGNYDENQPADEGGGGSLY